MLKFKPKSRLMSTIAMNESHHTPVGRPRLPEDQKLKRTTVSVHPKTIAEWGKFARRAQISKGHVVEWFLLAPEAKACRATALKQARLFVAPD